MELFHSLIAYYVFYNFNHCQLRHAKNFQDTEYTFDFFLNFFAWLSRLFGYGMLIYIGYVTDWRLPVFMMGLAWLVRFPIASIDALIPGIQHLLSLLAFVVVPIAGYFVLAPYI